MTDAFFRETGNGERETVFLVKKLKSEGVFSMEETWKVWQTFQV